MELVTSTALESTMMSIVSTLSNRAPSSIG